MTFAYRSPLEGKICGAMKIIALSTIVALAAPGSYAIDEKALELIEANPESPGNIEADDLDELPYISPPPPPLPDLRKLAIDQTVKDLLFASELPSRRRARLKRMVSGAYQHNDFQPFWAAAIPDIVIERISDTLKSHALDPFDIPDFASDSITEGPIKRAADVTVDDIRLTLQVAEAALLLKEGPATDALIWPSWNQGDTPGTIKTSVHTENLTATFSAQLRLNTPEPERILDSFVPENWIYARLRQSWLANVANPNPDRIKFQGNAYPGRAYDQAAELASILGMQGFIDSQSAEEASAAGVYTSALSDAVREFQRAHGLTPDGILGPKTLGRLERDPNRDRQRIVLNMHRARLIPNEMGRRYIMVNLPSGEIYGFKNHVLETQMRIVFGENTEGRRTPIFRDTLEQVIFRPYWWVPKGIAVEEYLPRAYRDPYSLTRRGFEIVKGGFEEATSLRINSTTLKGVADGKYILRQRAGYGNALGLVKFRFPNDHAVYFHDTPQKHLFKYTDRAHSHGCMRLEKPQMLAEWVLSEDPDWTTSKIKSAMSYGNRNVAQMKEPLHVFVVYFTVFPLPDREKGIAFLRDVYSRDMTSLGELVTENTAP